MFTLQEIEYQPPQMKCVNIFVLPAMIYCFIRSESLEFQLSNGNKFNLLAQIYNKLPHECSKDAFELFSTGFLNKIVENLTEIAILNRF
jgi:hypothetical protein